ncbi:hypothetical protein BMWSH_2645 [Priestia megaterium WSH-002]|uniref:Uncharacterized protein n=1 Tax=Priestia megaterium (strain WSH-002) TaxID=1006007 RepID=A0A8D3WZ46_PRIMW|nr:hypothetical protein BMWSH_2645 [Priestia megaterium WSH-002]
MLSLQLYWNYLIVYLAHSFFRKFSFSKQWDISSFLRHTTKKE